MPSPEDKAKMRLAPSGGDAASAPASTGPTSSDRSDRQAGPASAGPVRQGPPAGTAAPAATYRSAVHMAVLAGVFSLVVCALLLANYAAGRATDPLAPAHLTALKTQLVGRPSDEALKSEIRRLDKQVREEFFRRKAFARGGNWLLLAGLVVFLSAVKAARRRSQGLPRPGAAGPGVGGLAAGARVSVAVLGMVAAGAFVALGLAGRSDVGLEYARAVGVTGRAAPRGAAASAEEFAKNWPGFRGPGSAGVAAEGAAPPAHWDGAKGEGVLWKTAVPLPGENSPVVWGDRVFLSGATEAQREVYCFAADTGKLLWKQAVGAGSDAKPANVMEDTGYAAPTLATDGQRVFALFATGHVACFDFEGQMRWVRNLGVPESMYGHASSPAVYKDRLILQYDQGSAAEDGKSALLSLDTATGNTVWQTKRPVPNSWSTPIVIDTGKGREIITAGYPFVIAYDADSGAERWRAECLNGDVAPTPIFAGGFVFACNTGSELCAIRPGGTGNVTESAIAWRAMDGMPDTTSPASNGELVFLVTSEGMVTCYDVKTGARVWEHPYDKPFRSSPTLVGKMLTLMDRDGGMHLIEAGRAFKEVGTAALGEKSDCSPAFVGSRVYIRGKQNLYCIGGA